MDSTRSDAAPDPAAIDAAVQALRAGGTVCLPTETVYGLAADAENPAAVARVFALKGRPNEHPLIVHVGATEGMARYAREVPEAARRLAARFWPGPLTLVLARGDAALDCVTGGQDTVALRMPDHPLALAVLAAFGRGLAAPSANRFGRVSPTTPAHVRAEFGEAGPLILDGGPCRVGIESTICDLSGAQVRILRPGHIGAQAIAAAIGAPVAGGPQDGSPRVSGALPSHYAPATRTELLARERLDQRWRGLRRAGRAVRVLAIGALPAGSEGIALPAEPHAYARELYAALRRLDDAAVDAILVEAPPAGAAWSAVRDRLQRASAASRS